MEEEEGYQQILYLVLYCLYLFLELFCEFYMFLVSAWFSLPQKQFGS